MAKLRKAKSAGKNEAVKIAIIGGSGLYHMAGLTDTREVRVKTPFGDPSDAIVLGTLEGRRVAFLSRHGRGHRFSPSDINYRANICALKMLGAERILSVSAVGSLREDIAPLDFMIPDQFFDRTRGRASTFFTDGIVAHVGFAKPTCTALSEHLATACETTGVKVHRGGTYVCMEGPAFSTIAESHTYRQLRCDVIGMTGVTEAKLAREAELCYATTTPSRSTKSLRTWRKTRTTCSAPSAKPCARLRTSAHASVARHWLMPLSLTARSFPPRRKSAWRRSPESTFPRGARGVLART
jgi:5'-deoxy-5'-methylthioadenosine phosphorylase